MSVYYIDSNRINGFPTTKRASKNKQLSENSITRLINRLLDVEGYVITTGLPSLENYSTGIPVDVWQLNYSDFEFVIRGYYFGISGDENVSGLHYLMKSTGFDTKGGQIEHNLYATIFIDKTNPDYPELYGQDAPDYTPEKWMAIQFTIDDEEPKKPEDISEDNYVAYTFKLVSHMQNDKGNWGKYVPMDSIFRFTSKAISDIDGGEVVINS